MCPATMNMLHQHVSLQDHSAPDALTFDTPRPIDGEDDPSPLYVISSLRMHSYNVLSLRSILMVASEDSPRVLSLDW